MTTRRIPFVDLLSQYEAHKDEYDSALRSVIQKSAFIGGEFVSNFERSYAKACGVKHCIPVANGTDAIYVVLRMLGIGPGDEVITTAASWISTSETIGQTGARPVFVDVDEFYNLDVRLLEEKINVRTKAIIPVHLYGQAARIELIEEIASRHKLALVEDCAQAHFAERTPEGSTQARMVGTFGVAGTFSFYPGKNLGAYGDAGAIITDDDALASRCRMFANHGALVKHQHQIEGINSRMDGLQAALLSAKLPYLAEWTEARRRVAAIYNSLLADIKEVVTPVVCPRSSHVYHLYVVRCERRDTLREWLSASGIETAVHYPTALPFLPAYRHLGLTESSFPNAARNQQEILSLPIYPELTSRQVEYIVSEIRRFYSMTRS